MKVAAAEAAVKQRGGEDWQQHRARQQARHTQPTALLQDALELGCHRWLTMMMMMMDVTMRMRMTTSTVKKRRALRGKRFPVGLQRALNGATAAPVVEAAVQKATMVRRKGATAQRTLLL